MIITRVSGGLGNQLFQYAAAYTLAKQKGTSFLLDTRWYNDKQGRQFVLDAFQTEISVASEKDIQLYCHNRFQKILFRLGIGVHHPILKDPKNKLVDFSERGKNVYLFGYWTDERYFSENLPIIRKQFTLRPHLFTNAYHELSTMLQQGNWVALHIRRGDFTDNYNQAYFGLLPFSYYKDAIAYIQQRVETPRYIIFSDDATWVKQQMPFSNATIYAEDFGIETDYLEFALMQQCHHQVMANSTFSWWAALLNGNVNKIVIQPKHWYQHPGVQEAYASKFILYQRGTVRL